MSQFPPLLLSFQISNKYEQILSLSAFEQNPNVSRFDSSAWMTCNAAFRFIYSAISAAMGCLFGCFRARTDPCPPRTHLVSEPAVARSRRNVNSPNQFTSLLVSEEYDEFPCKDDRNPSSGFQKTEITDRDLQYQAKFLKACGVLMETPPEIRKSREHLCNSEDQDSDSGTPKYHSWYPNTSVEKLCLKKEGHTQSLKPLKLSKECQDGSISSEHSTDSFISCMEITETGGSLTDDRESQIANLTSSICKIPDNELDTSPVMNSPQLSSAVVKSKAKSVHFAREPDARLSCRVETPGYLGVFEYSPHPTPLKLTDEMQTPGTIYAANLDSATRGRNARIRSQYVYAALNPVDNISQLRMLKEEDSGEKDGVMENPNNDATQLPDTTVIESSELHFDTPGNYSSGKDKVDKVVNGEATLSTWLRPPPPSSGTVNETKSGEVLPTRILGSTPTPGSRPILGVLSASYMNRDKKSSDVSTKCWDGNGIPNTTTKYKEYQKVRWHATPFEERLEKALSVEGSIPDRRHTDGIPIVYEDDGEDEEEEEEDTESPPLHTQACLPSIEHSIDISY